MVFVRENFFYRKFFIEKMQIKNTRDILYIGCVLYRHFRSKIINRSALIEGHKFILKIGLLKKESSSAIISFDMASLILSSQYDFCSSILFSRK